MPARCCPLTEEYKLIETYGACYSYTGSLTVDLVSVDFR
jgi:hypothetical protein